MRMKSVFFSTIPKAAKELPVFVMTTPRRRAVALLMLFALAFLSSGSAGGSGGFVSALSSGSSASSRQESSRLVADIDANRCTLHLGVSRRSILFAPAAAVASGTGLVGLPSSSLAAGSNGLPLITAPSGLKWADAKVGSGQPLKVGNSASIDYSMASTAGRFPQIYTTKDKGTPYRWTLGDGSTIAGIEKAIIGDDSENIPPMMPGGVRRVIVPSSLGYQRLAVADAKCIEGVDGAVGPIPPKDGSGSYQRWVQFYCNPRIPYQPDLVLDIKLYGKR